MAKKLSEKEMKQLMEIARKYKEDGHSHATAMHMAAEDIRERQTRRK